MKLLAVICEYNPFHNGHAYQLNKQKKELGCDGVICLMSGSFVQRGEPAILDKWARAEMALNAGCDLLLELPVLYSLQSAEGFARGAVTLLHQLGFEGYLGFGSESGDASALNNAVNLMESEAFGEALRHSLSLGNSYPKACAEALNRVSPKETITLCPNDILGMEYIKAIRSVNARLVPVPLKRQGSGHDSLVPADHTLSATGIRKALLEDVSVSPYLPKEALAILRRELQAGKGPVSPVALSLLLCYALRNKTREELAQISGMSEGLEKRLQDAAAQHRTFNEMALFAKTKRYPQTRIQRVMLNTVLGITKEDEVIRPAYARVLGMNKKGPAILRHMEKTTDIPIIIKMADANLPTNAGKRLLELDLLATDIYSLLYPDKKAGKNGMDFYRTPVMVNK